MSYQTEQQRRRQREEEERRRRHQSHTGSSSDLMNPLNPISPIYVGNDYSSLSRSDSCSGGYDSGSSSDSGGSCGAD